MTERLFLLAEEVAPTPTPTPTPYPDYLQYHYLTNFFSGELEFWTVLNVVLTCGIAFIIVFAILFLRYRNKNTSKK